MNVLTARQEYVLAQLYMMHRWSVPKISRTLGLGRRLIENRLCRCNVELVRRGFDRSNLSEVAALQWFLAAGFPNRAFEDPEPPTKAMGELVLYRRRRCQSCATLNVYRDVCHRCGESLEHASHDLTEEDPAIAVLRLSEERRGLYAEAVLGRYVA